VLTYEELKSIRKESKKIWRKMCDKHGPIGAPWTTISPNRQQEFFLKIEHKYPLLRLCENHYKAECVSFSDYSHWYDKWFPDDDDKPEPARLRKRSRTASPVKPRKGRRLAKKARRVEVVQDDGDSSGDSSTDESSSDESSSEDENAKNDQDDRDNEGSGDELDADVDTGRLPRQLPFSPVRRTP
jgi:hypothetical protein